MNRIRFMLMAALTVIMTAVLSHAASLKVQVGEFAVTGAANSDELKAALPALLSSRLSGDGISTVDTPAGADALVLGSYTAFGAMFSIDASVKAPSGEIVGRTFVQGKGVDDLIPAVGRLAEQLRPVINGVTAVPVAKAEAKIEAPRAPAMPLEAAQPAAAAGAAAMVPTVKGDVVAIPGGDIVRVAPADKPVTRLSRIDGAMLGMAPVRTLPTGEREVALADAKAVYLYRHGNGVTTKIAEYPVKGEGKILALDSADADNDGQVEVYATVMDREELVSIALMPGDKGFTLVADRLPFYFRAVTVSAGTRQLLAQQIGKDKEDFYGQVCRVVKAGARFSLGEPVKLPEYANIFSFSRFTSNDGKTITIVIDPDGNLRVIGEEGEELWKGSDRFGGSEVYFKRDEQQMQNLAMDRYRWRFIEQRMVAAPNGEIIVPRNSGLFVLGNSRSYSKNILFGFAWNGASLEERWHTKESANYLADYFFDAERRELVVLEQVQREGLFGKGASAVSIKKID